MNCKWVSHSIKKSFPLVHFVIAVILVFVLLSKKFVFAFYLFKVVVVFGARELFWVRVQFKCFLVLNHYVGVKMWSRVTKYPPLEDVTWMMKTDPCVATICLGLIHGCVVDSTIFVIMNCILNDCYRVTNEFGIRVYFVKSFFNWDSHSLI